MKLLVDLSILRHPYCGLGQIALNYARWYGEHGNTQCPSLDITLLVPKHLVGAFGDKVAYLPALDIYRTFPWLMPHFDLWHSIHQLSPFRPTGNTRRILTIHDLNFLYEKSPRKQQRYLRRLQDECDRSAAICFISHFAEQEASAHLTLHGQPTHVVYNGVETLTEGHQEQPQGVDPSRSFFLNIGVVKAKKNQHTLLESMQLLPDYNLVIAGNDSDPYAQQLRSRLPENVTMLGPVSDDQRRWLYAHCCALLMPSLCEGFGLPAIEAMQWGKPVFLSHLTSLPEIGSHHACYFHHFAPQEMASTILEGLKGFTPEKAQAERLYAATFNYDKHLHQYLEIFANLPCHP